MSTLAGRILARLGAAVRSGARFVCEGLTWTGFGICPVGVDADVVAEVVRSREAGAGSGADDDPPAPEPWPGRPLSRAERASWETLEERLRHGSPTTDRLE